MFSSFARFLKTKDAGLEINSSKCDFHFCSSFDQTVYDKFAEISPGIQSVSF